MPTFIIESRAKPITEEWIQKHVDVLLEMAKKLEQGPMQNALVLRAEYYMDLVQAHRENE